MGLFAFASAQQVARGVNRLLRLAVNLRLVSRVSLVLLVAALARLRALVGYLLVDALVHIFFRAECRDCKLKLLVQVSLGLLVFWPCLCDHVEVLLPVYCALIADRRQHRHPAHSGNYFGESVLLRLLVRIVKQVDDFLVAVMRKSRLLPRATKRLLTHARVAFVKVLEA